MDTRDELQARILVVAARIKKGEDRLRRIIRDLRTCLVKCNDIGGGIFGYLLWTITNLLFLYNKDFI
jgi:hypothetical protein